MNIILLSGGSGKRLWPLSNEIRSKQFLQLFKNPAGEYESMVQRVYRQLRMIDSNVNITIATSKAQVPSIHKQLGNDISISIEPSRRDTFPAIVLATAYVHEILKVDRDETVVVCPIDQYVEEEYFHTLKKMSAQVALGEANLVLMGIVPTYPSEKYGYIIPESSAEVAAVTAFKEKPTREKAKDYIEQGALWNGGVFAYKLGYVLDKAIELLGTDSYTELYSQYEKYDKISFDYAVVEKENSIQVLQYKGKWSDLGSWNILTEMMDETIIGDAIIDDLCKNVHVVNELDIPVLTMGLKDVVVAASPDGILVSDKAGSESLKTYVEKIHREAAFAEKSWGCFKVIDAEHGSLVMKVTITPGDSMNYHSHERRDEVWVVIEGKGRTIVDGMEQKIKVGDVITMKAGCRHTVIAESELKLIEVQLGKEISIEDKNIYPLER